MNQLSMGFPDLLAFFFVFLVSFCDAHECPESFFCENLETQLEYPFTIRPNCGPSIEVEHCDPPRRPPRVFLESEDRPPRGYDVLKINMSSHEMTLQDHILRSTLEKRKCAAFTSIIPQPINSPNISFTISRNQNLTTLFTCDDRTGSVRDHFKNYRKYSDCRGSTTVYWGGNLTRDEDPQIPSECSSIQLPINATYENSSGDDLFKLLSCEYTIEWKVSTHDEAGTYWKVSTHDEAKDKKMMIVLAAVIPGAVFLVCLLACFIIWRSKKRVSNAYGLSRNISSDPLSKSDIEGGSLCFGIPVFSYTELVDATNNFDSARELGDGGFGTVYYGKLRDGKEVAIKRLYEHNYRRVEQFMNEIKILTCLKHPNLVSLYGCTSRRSRELLLVYEYVENGTVADHLHGERAEESPLTWSTRMNIAIETATALTYLHESDIIHRDVKTNNILLDRNFCVKVADFGLSKLFPIGATHISTAPQGTPGYVDPEYHQCYQLTGKSDVYSFGVVLVELISSMPAVDISRHRHEINLANLALNKIQKCDFEELIDSSLGYGTDAEVTRMTTSVAELAFRCLQPEKEMRPSMEEVLDHLKDIQSGDELMFERPKAGNGNRKMLHSPETDEVVLLKNKNLQSPVAVTDKWISSSSTIESSIE